MKLEKYRTKSILSTASALIRLVIGGHVTETETLGYFSALSRVSALEGKNPAVIALIHCRSVVVRLH